MKMYLILKSKKLHTWNNINKQINFNLFMKIKKYIFMLAIGKNEIFGL